MSYNCDKIHIFSQNNTKKVKKKIFAVYQANILHKNDRLKAHLIYIFIQIKKKANGFLFDRNSEYKRNINQGRAA